MHLLNYHILAPCPDLLAKHFAWSVFKCHTSGSNIKPPMVLNNRIPSGSLQSIKAHTHTNKHTSIGSSLAAIKSASVAVIVHSRVMSYLTFECNNFLRCSPVDDDRFLFHKGAWDFLLLLLLHPMDAEWVLLTHSPTARDFPILQPKRCGAAAWENPSEWKFKGANCARRTANAIIARHGLVTGLSDK